MYLQDQVIGCTALQTYKECHDSVSSIVVANLFTWFLRQFEIFGNFDTMSIDKALTLILTSLVRSEYNLKIYFIQYGILTGPDSRYGMNRNCTIMHLDVIVISSGLRDPKELLLIESWLNSMIITLTDTNESGYVVTFTSKKDNIVFLRNSTDRNINVVEYRKLTDINTWKNTPSFSRFIQEIPTSLEPPCLEIEFRSDPQNIEIKCKKHLKISSKTTKILPEMFLCTFCLHLVLLAFP